MFGPLSFPTRDSSKCKSQLVGLDDDPLETKCLLCDVTYTLPNDQKSLLTHIFKEHRLIGEVQKSYIHYWKISFSEAPLTQFCTTLLTDCTPDEKASNNEAYSLLSYCTTDDQTLRSEIQQAKLEWDLTQQAKERSDTSFKRGCMFCRTEFSGSRINYLHLSNRHRLA